MFYLAGVASISTDRECIRHAVRAGVDWIVIRSAILMPCVMRPGSVYDQHFVALNHRHCMDVFTAAVVMYGNVVNQWICQVGYLAVAVDNSSVDCQLQLRYVAVI